MVLSLSKTTLTFRMLAHTFHRSVQIQTESFKNFAGFDVIDLNGDFIGLDSIIWPMVFILYKSQTVQGTDHN